MGVVFKLVHLSDLHFAVKPNRLPSPIQTGGLSALFKAAVSGHRGNWFKPASHSTRAARAVARYLSTTVIPSESPDLLVISGDLAATGDAGDLASARDFIRGDSSGFWSSTDDEPRLPVDRIKLQVMPGNHDRYHKGTLLPGSDAFEQVFAGIWAVSSSSDRVSEPFIIEKSGEMLAIISADFTFRRASDSSSLTGYIGQGKVYQDVLDALKVKTLDVKSVASRNIAVVWMVHYPPRYPDVDPNLSLSGEDDLLNMASELGVNLLLAGHTHVACLYDVDGINVSCVGSATQADPDSAWHFSLNEVVVESGVITSGKVIPFSYVKSGRNNFVRGDEESLVL